MESDLAAKHEAMARSPFEFLRATYYRWAELYPQLCPELAAAPEVAAVGDLHIENFGIWRDAEGRLVWGINDFDEAHPLAYTNDLVRLATSARLARAVGHLRLSLKEMSSLILEGYRDGLRSGGEPFVLEERHRALRRMALASAERPDRFWSRLDRLPTMTRRIPAPARTLLEKALPHAVDLRFATRRAGLGSLGHLRVVALAQSDGGRVAREAKALVPPASVWVSGGSPSLDYLEVAGRAVRDPDPFLEVTGGFVVRRLAPDVGRIELADAPSRGDERDILRAMGRETANIHLGSGDIAITRVLADLDARTGANPDWLRDAARTMLSAARHDQQRWARHRHSTKAPQTIV